VLKSFVLLGGRACGECGVFRFRLMAIFYRFCLNAFPSSTKYVGVLLILFGHVFDTNPIWFNLLLCMDCTLAAVHFLDGIWYFVLSGSTVPLMI
jgi:hypothetical protein